MSILRDQCQQLLDLLPEIGLEETKRFLGYAIEFYNSPIALPIEPVQIQSFQAKMGETYTRPSFSILDDE